MYRQQLEHIDRISAKPADDDEHAQMELFNPNEYKANRQVHVPRKSASGFVAHANCRTNLESIANFCMLFSTPNLTIITTKAAVDSKKIIRSNTSVESGYI